MGCAHERDGYVIEAPLQAAANVAGGGLFPVRRIFCIGRNYADHVREMGGDLKASPPVFFTKPADAIVANGAVVPYPQATTDLHYEGELVVALKGGGRDIETSAAESLIYGFAAGCDLTRRDLQSAAKKAGAPWDAAKAFDNSAPVGPIAPLPLAALFGMSLSLSVNGEPRQSAPLSTMIWSVPELLAGLSRLFELRAGDLVFTGTPEGVGPLARGDTVEVALAPLPPLRFSIGG